LNFGFNFQLTSLESEIVISFWLQRRANWVQLADFWFGFRSITVLIKFIILCMQDPCLVSVVADMAGAVDLVERFRNWLKQ
jgi:hypothetical protein